MKENDNNSTKKGIKDERKNRKKGKNNNTVKKED